MLFRWVVWKLLLTSRQTRLRVLGDVIRKERLQNLTFYGGSADSSIENCGLTNSPSINLTTSFMLRYFCLFDRALKHVVHENSTASYAFAYGNDNHL